MMTKKAAVIRALVVTFAVAFVGALSATTGTNVNNNNTQNNNNNQQYTQPEGGGCCGPSQPQSGGTQ